MKELLVKYLLLGTAALLTATAASAEILTFDELGYSGDSEFSSQFVSSPYSTGGYTFTSTGGTLAGFDVSRYSVFGDLNPRNADQGGATLISNREGALNTLTRDDGMAFDLLSIDLAGTTGFDGDGGTVRFYANGDTANFFDFDFNSDTMLTSFDLPFRNVTSLSFIGQSTAFYQIDNVNVSLAGSSGAVPEPATWAMMIGGFGLVGGAMRRRRNTGVPAIA
jgi:hypothetical protein